MSEGLAVYAAVFAASVLGSLHCVGMCGGFVAAVSGGSCEGQRELGPLWSYQGARLLAYAGLGAVAGALGAGLDHGAALLGLRQLAAPAMGLTLIAVATLSLLGLEGRASAEPLVTLAGARSRPSALTGLRQALTRFVARRGIAAGAAAGLLSALLPCGWLWAYVAVAAATGSASTGALVMASFWLGSVPALLAVGLLTDTLLRRLGRARAGAAKLGALLMLALGLLALFGRLGVPLPELPPARGEPEPAQTELETTPAELPASAPCH